MQKKIRLTAGLRARFGLQAHRFCPAPPVEVCELHYEVDDLTGDGRGLA